MVHPFSGYLKVRVLMRRNRVRGSISVILTGLLLAGCDLGTGLFGVSNTRYSASEDFSHTITVTSQTEFVVQGINGFIEVIGVPDATEVNVWGERRVESESTADARDHLDELLVLVSDTASRITVRTDQPRDSHGRNYIVEYYCSVPDDWLVGVQQTNGNIEVSLLIGDVEISSTNGNVSADSLYSEVDIQLTNGNLLLWDLFGNVDAGLTNGNITARVTIPLSGVCELGVTNGLIDLRIPTTTSAELGAYVVNGSISTVNLSLQDITSTPTSLTGTLGGGSGTITLRNTNGTITVTGY